jgi:hypothetical protein
MGVARATSRVSLSWHGGPNGLPSLPLAALLAAAAGLSLWSIIPLVEAVFTGYYAFDWVIFTQASDRLDDGTLYQFSEFYAYRWSPAAAWILGFVTLMPLWLWQVLHVAVLPLLRSWWLVVVCLITFPLWFDIQTGNLMIFIAVTGFWAYRGNGPATALFLVLTLLVPRPLMVPLTAWILWMRPDWRLPFLVLFVGHGALAVASGYAAEWLDALFRVGPELTSDFNYGPSRFIGLWWVPVGLAFALWLTWRGRLGLASLAISPYWLPYYFLMVLLDFAPGPPPPPSRSEAVVASRTGSPADME